MSLRLLLSELNCCKKKLEPEPTYDDDDYNILSIDKLKQSMIEVLGELDTKYIRKINKTERALVNSIKIESHSKILNFLNKNQQKHRKLTSSLKTSNSEKRKLTESSIQ